MARTDRRFYRGRFFGWTGIYQFTGYFSPSCLRHIDLTCRVTHLVDRFPLLSHSETFAITVPRRRPANDLRWRAADLRRARACRTTRVRRAKCYIDVDRRI